MRAGEWSRRGDGDGSGLGLHPAEEAAVAAADCQDLRTVPKSDPRPSVGFADDVGDRTQVDHGTSMGLLEDFAVWFFDQFLAGEEMGGFTGDSLGMVLSRRRGPEGAYSGPLAGAPRKPSATNGPFRQTNGCRWRTSRTGWGFGAMTPRLEPADSPGPFPSWRRKWAGNRIRG